MNSIQILGVNGYEKTSNLKSNVLKALAELRLESEVEEVTNIDDLMESEISAVPALRVNGKVVAQQVVPSVEDLKILLKTLLQAPPPPFQVKNLLVPTDFSKTAAGAYRFALDMASGEEDASVSLVHCFHPETDPAYPYLGVNSAVFLDDKKEALKQFKTSFPIVEEATVQVEAKLVTGFADEEIIRLSARPGLDMIVMGSTGKTGLLDKLLGSVSFPVAQKAHCPVMLIPNGARYRGFKNVLYASNYESADPATLQRLKDFATHFQSCIHFVHVWDDRGLEDYLEVETRIFDTLFQGEDPTYPISMTTVSADSVVDGINDYAVRNDIDLIIMLSPHRNFWKNLLHKSTTKAMALHTGIPILVYHTEG